MKKVIALMILVMAGVVGASAQTPVTSQTANEGFIGYSFVRTGDDRTIQFNEDTDSHGVNAAYTRYFGGSATKAGVVGITGDLGANFTGNDEALVTVMGGVTLKARNAKYVQPYVRGLAGVAKQNVRVDNLGNFSDWSSAYALGGGLDINTKKYSRYKIRVGADYMNTGFFGERQHGIRFTTGLVF